MLKAEWTLLTRAGAAKTKKNCHPKWKHTKAKQKWNWKVDRQIIKIYLLLGNWTTVLMEVDTVKRKVYIHHFI